MEFKLCSGCGVGGLEGEELRPYGVNGALICYDCMLKDEATAVQQFAKLKMGVDISRAQAEDAARAAQAMRNAGTLTHSVNAQLRLQ